MEANSQLFELRTTYMDRLSHIEVILSELNIDQPDSQLL